MACKNSWLTKDDRCRATEEHIRCNGIYCNCWIPENRTIDPDPIVGYVSMFAVDDTKVLKKGIRRSELDDPFRTILLFNAEKNALIGNVVLHSEEQYRALEQKHDDLIKKYNDLLKRVCDRFNKDGD